ncbi:MAG: SpoIIE family protein phosphatase [Oscillospiraceae bacterium]|nr:SpoIIE family protein phosphatase [Oscillospiraceae bacterium]
MGAAREALAAALPYRVGLAQRPREGQSVSGDVLSVFETPQGTLCLLLSDGMGSGEEARRESALAVRLLERFLKAGIEPRIALKTLASALSIRSEATESFTTVDLLTLPLGGGTAELYKLGAAPSYVKRGGKVRRVTCSCLPAGLAAQEAEVTKLELSRGSVFVMLTDGIADAPDDKWLTALLRTFTGDAQKLALHILDESGKQRGLTDDAAVLVLEILREDTREV